jgi:hypothetical protein
MKCYTINGRGKHNGIRLSSHQGVGACVDLGDERDKDQTVIPLSDFHQEVMKDMSRNDLPLLQYAEWADETIQIVPGLVEDTGAWNKAVLSLQTTCLIKVCLTPKRGGILKWTAKAYEDKMRNGVVISSYFPFPSLGVEILAIGGRRYPQYLFRMIRGAGFRIQRVGKKLDIGDWALISAKWTGSDLQANVSLISSSGQRRSAA